MYNFRYEILVVSACLVSFLSFMLNFIVFLMFLFFIKGLPSILSLYIIAPIVGIFFLSLGLSFALSVFFIKYRDIGYLWDIFLQIGFWISPIAYPIDIVPVEFLEIYMLNPIARIVTLSRETILYNQLPNTMMLLISLVIPIILLILGYLLYRFNYRKFIEYI